MKLGIIKRHFYLFIVGAIFLLSLVTDWYYPLSILFAAATALTVIDKLGKGIVLRELIVLHGIFVCLLMPIAGYEIYNEHNHLSRIFIKYMLVPRDKYFSYVLPALSAFALAVCWPVSRRKVALDEGPGFRYILDQIRSKLATNRTVGLYVIAAGFIISFLGNYGPAAFQFVASLFYSCCFAGGLYIYFSPSFRYKKLILGVFALFIVYTAVQTGVFTIVAYMGITLFSFFFIGRQQRLWKKLLVCGAMAILLVLLQNVKAAFRKVAWKDSYAGSRTRLFTDIAQSKLSSWDQLTDVNGLFPIYTRANQGFNISLVMRWIPEAKDFDHGQRMAVIVASSLVPWLFWPDKPEAGGKESMFYFTGLRIHGWSTNVSPVGEAYGSFGVAGGIFFLFILGLFIRWAYYRTFFIATRIPLVILWLPVLFYQVTYSMETDTLQILNSLLKSAFFLWALYKLIPSWFGIAKKDRRWHAARPHPNLPV